MIKPLGRPDISLSMVKQEVNVLISSKTKGSESGKDCVTVANEKPSKSKN